MLALACRPFVLTHCLLELGWGYLVDMVVDVFHGAELLEQLGSCLLTNAGDTGDVIRLVANQALEVGNLLWFHSVPVADRCLVIQRGITKTLSMLGVEYLYQW